jgi:hypothetical protein
MSRSEEIVVGAIVFVILWLLASLIWSIWLDGIYVPIAGLITSGLGTGVITGVISVNR